MHHTNKLIIQLESLMKLVEDDDNSIIIPNYDIVVLDEIEGLLNQFDSPTLKRLNARYLFELFTNILKYSKKVIALDGDMAKRSYNFLSNIIDTTSTNNKPIHIVNNFQSEKHITVTNNKTEFDNTLFNDINNNDNNNINRVFICCQSINDAELLKQDIINKYNHLEEKILLVSSKIDDALRMEIMTDVNKYILDKDVRVFIITPSIEAGVDVTVEFTKVYGMLKGCSNSPRQFLQMLGRVRNCTNNTIMLYNANYSFTTSNQLITYSELEEQVSQFFGEEDIKPELKTVSSDDSSTTFQYVFSAFDKNEINNLLEHKNASFTLFLSQLSVLCVSKGWTITLVDGNNNKHHKKSKDKTENIIVANILKADSITSMEEFEMIQSKKEKTSFEKYQIQKYVLQKMLATDELTEEHVKTFIHSNLLSNYISLRNNNSNSNNDEPIKQQLLLKQKLKQYRLTIIRTIIDTFGFNTEDSSITVPKNEALFERTKTLLSTCSIFTDKTKTEALFDVSFKTITDNTKRGFLDYINTVLKSFGVKIKSADAYMNKKKCVAYQLIHTHSLDEIYHRKFHKEFDDAFIDDEETEENKKALNSIEI